MQIAINAIAGQDESNRKFCVLVVDNASQPPLVDRLLAPLWERDISARTIYEEQPGIARARLRAINETRGEWILFVDDDNEIASDYLQQGFSFIDEHPEVGCFGGKLLLAPNLSPPDWIDPFLPYLGIKNFGDDPIIETRDEWGPWEPPTAGAWVRRDVLNAYARRANADPRLFALGRTGLFDLASCEDSFMMRGAYSLNAASAYHPGLSLYHYLAPHRFEYQYLLPLIAAYGRSQVLLEWLLGREYPLCNELAQEDKFNGILDWIFNDRTKSARFRSAQMAWYITARHQSLAKRAGVLA